jgi:cytoskeletal protein CcmA (bactofilin family)
MSLTETKSAQAAPSTTDSNRESRKTSLIASDLEVIGDLKSKGEIQIEGKVKGEVRSTSATVSPGAEIDGSIVADAVEVAGQVKGRIEARQVRILKSAKMLGDVVHEMLEIEAGAEIEGAFQRLASGGKK